MGLALGVKERSRFADTAYEAVRSSKAEDKPLTFQMQDSSHVPISSRGPLQRDSYKICQRNLKKHLITQNPAHINPTKPVQTPYTH